MTATMITVETLINAHIDTVWEKWISPEEIMQWYNASPDWHAPKAENDVRNGGKFLTRMEAKDGSFGFDFIGEYNSVKPKESLEITLGDDRTMTVIFEVIGNETKVTEIFEAEKENPVEMQKAGWQAILDNFKKHVESN